MSQLTANYAALQKVLTDQAHYSTLQALPVLAHFERTGELLEIKREQVQYYKLNGYKVVDVFALWLDGRKQAKNRRLYL